MRTVVPNTNRRPIATLARIALARPLALAFILSILGGSLSVGVVGAGEPRSVPVAAEPRSAVTAADPQLRPTIQYEEAMAHAADDVTFAPGDRVTVPFTPRKTDRWAVGGVRPTSLPAGRISGRAMRQETGPTTLPRSVDGRAAVGSVDIPYLAEDGPVADLAAAVDPGGLRREVFGFLPYWELTDSSTRLDWEKLSTVAYFGVGAAADGDLQKRNTDGSTTVGWSGWTSSKMTSVINAAHASGARVVLTVQSFAWSSAGVKRQKALLGSASARNNLARQIAAAVRDRGADGVNLDFEPIVSGYADEFTTLVRSVRSELNKVHKGYQLTFDTTGWIGNYPIEDATGSAGADAVVVMGYDYRSGSSKTVGSVAPIGGPGYDIGDTIKAYRSRLPASRIILGVPYYGRAWSTDSSRLNATNISGTKYGASTTVVYTTARQYAADNGRQYDTVEDVAWTAYRRQNCTNAYGCVNPWRQIYYDDKPALAAKYDLVNGYNLRGAAIWALGYDGTRTELYQALEDKFITDSVPPAIASSSISTAVVSPNGDGRLDSTTIKASVTGHLKFGWDVQPYSDGSVGASVRSGSVSSKTVSFTWDGRNDGGKVVSDGTYRITVWAADASNNRAYVRKLVTVDRRAAVVTLSSSRAFLSPDGDGRADKVALSLRADEPVTGKARVLAGDGSTVTRWTVAATTGRSVTWNGYDRAGRRVADGRYTFRVKGLDRAGNRTVRDLRVNVDRTIKSVTWASSAFIPKRGEKDRLTFALRRRATVTVAIYDGSTRVRKVWTDRSLSAGPWRWNWDGKTAAGVRLSPGSYRAVVTAKSRIGTSTFSRKVTIRLP